MSVCCPAVDAAAAAASREGKFTHFSRTRNARTYTLTHTHTHTHAPDPFCQVRSVHRARTHTAPKIPIAPKTPVSPNGCPHTHTHTLYTAPRTGTHDSTDTHKHAHSQRDTHAKAGTRLSEQLRTLFPGRNHALPSLTHSLSLFRTLGAGVCV